MFEPQVQCLMQRKVRKEDSNVAENYLKNFQQGVSITSNHEYIGDILCKKYKYVVFEA